MAVCEACGTLDASAFEFDGITFELCRHHAHVWMARCMKEDREEAEQRLNRYARVESAGTLENGVLEGRVFTVSRAKVFERPARIDQGWEFWYVRWVRNDTGLQSRQLSHLHKTAKTKPTMTKTLARYCDGGRTFVMRQVRSGFVQAAWLYENGFRVEFGE